MYCERCQKDYDEFTLICPQCWGSTSDKEEQPVPVKAPPYTPPYSPQTPPYTQQGYSYMPPQYVAPQYAPYTPPQTDNPTAVWKVLGFFVPLAGLILYAVWKDEKPLTARALGKFALLGFIVNFLVSGFFWVGSILFGILDSL